MTTLKESIKNLLKKLHLKDPIIFLQRRGKFMIRHLKALDTKIINKYFNNNITKLHISYFNNILSGWLNSDYFPEKIYILHFDATREFLFKNN